MIRFAVLGWCQAVPFAKCIRFLVPGCEADPHVILESASSAAEFNNLAPRLTAYDFVLALTRWRDSLAALPAIANNSTKVVYYPSVEFTAYHPDLIYILRTDTAPHSILKSPIGDYHSALAFLCYSLGLNPEQTVARFNGATFSRLGYLAESLWSSSEQNLLNAGRAAQLPVERFFRSWVRRGCFMYSPNHPKLFVIADLAAAALAACGVMVESRLCEEYVPDDAKLGPIWPVYPEIAAKFGVNGSYCYKGFSAADGTCAYFSLREFVEASFVFYRNCNLAALYCPRVEAWKGDRDLVDYIMSDTECGPVIDPQEPTASTPPADGASLVLPCNRKIGLCFLDWINSVPAATARKVLVPFESSIVFSGWAADIRNGTPAGGVDVVVDGVPYSAIYGIARSDVAQAHGDPFENSGFQFSLPPGVLSRGVHSFTIRVITHDRGAYWEGPSGRLIVD
jgi:Polysaccharide biosynthesis enzyme WcbI